MNAGAITLQCPACGGVFLTLQHGGQTEICPHCAVTGPRASFRAVADPGQARERSDLPAAKAQTETASSPGFSQGPRPPVFDTPFPLAPEGFFTTRDTGKPAAPEAPAPKVDVPPLPDFKIPGPTNGNGHASASPPAVASAKESPLPVSNFPDAKTPAPFAAEAKAPAPLSAPAEEVKSRLPVWPGLDLDEAKSHEEDFPPKTEEPPAESKAPAPVRKSSYVPRLARMGLSVVILLCAGWVFWQRHGKITSAPVNPPKPVIAIAPPTPTPAPAPSPVTPPVPTPAPKPPDIASASVTPPVTAPEPKPPVIASVQTPPPAPVPVPAPAPKPEPPAVTPPKPQPPPPTVAEVTRTAEPVTPKPTPAPPAPVAGPSVETVTVLMKGLEAAKNTSQRLELISDPQAHRMQVEEYFQVHRVPLGAAAPEGSSGSVALLPGGQEAKLFRMATERCPEGALLFFHMTNGRPLLDWPLFAQCQDHVYDEFAVGDKMGPTPWFTVLGRRTHATALKGPGKDQWLTFDAQGSLAGAGAAVVYVDKDSPAGRYLDDNLKWDRIYLTDLQLGKKRIEGQILNVILDCAGTRDGKAISGRKK